jgi:uncharacterized Zn-binding protein involved in type VI secretion
MDKPFIVLGDKTDHGGTVISGDFTFIINGKSVARVGDMTVCPKCKGTFPITTGAEDMISMGQAPARHGDKTACGATLLATQFTTTIDSGRVGGPAATGDAQQALAEATQAVAAEAPTICLDCLMKAAANGSGMVVRG